MAHTNETVNFHLSQFVGTDIPNPLTDYNGDMVKIDTAIKNVADEAVAEVGRIVALETQNGSETLDTTAQTLSGAVNELKGDVDGIDTRLTTAEGKLIADESTLATAVGNISTLAGKVSAVETKVGTAVLDTVAADLSGAVNELKAEIDGSGVGSLTSRVAALEVQNGSEVLQTTAQTLSGAINELYNAPAGSVSADDVSFDGTASGLSATNVQDAIDEIAGEIPVITETEEKQTGTLASGATSVTLTFTEQTIGATTLVLPFTSEFGVAPTAITTTSTTVVMTFTALDHAITVGALIKN